MKLNRLTIHKFKGIEDFEIKPNGADVTIRGENGTGKTTVADALAWVITGKGINGSTIESQIKLRGADGNTPNDGGVEHTVEAELQDDQGNAVTVKKTYVEKWQKKRGDAENCFTGNTTLYSINDVPLSKTEFESRMSQICKEDAFRLLSMPLSFCQMKWQDRRKILTEIIGEISPADIIATSKELAPLTDMLDGKSIEDLRKTLQASGKKTNEAMKGIPARIDELSKLTGENDLEELPVKETLMQEIASIQKQKSALQQELDTMRSGGAAGKLRKELAEHEARLAERKTKLLSGGLAAREDTEKKLSKLRSQLSSVGDEMETVTKKKEQLETICESTQKLMANLRSEWQEENAKVFEADISETCPYCGQPLPSDKVEEARRNAEDDFNLKKSRKLREINEKGKAMKAQTEENGKRIQLSKDKLAEMQKRCDELALQIGSLEQQLDGMAEPNLEDDAEYQKILQEINRCKKAINSAGEADQDEVRRLTSEITALDLDISARNEKMAEIQQAEKSKSRIEELKQEEKELGQQWNDIQHKLYLTEQYLRAQVKLTEDSINEHFEHVRWKMFDQQINGGLKECCDPLIDGVPYSDGLNKGSRMKASLDILNTLSRHYGKKLPIIIDDCESYTSLIPVDSQIIRLIADACCKELTVETA